MVGPITLMIQLMNKLLQNGRTAMNEKTKSKVLNYLTKKHGSKALAYHMEKYFRFTLDHAQKDGMIKIVTAENGDEYVKLLKSKEEMEAWFKKEQDQMKSGAIN